jgi:hypothetical protein
VNEWSIYSCRLIKTIIYIVGWYLFFINLKTSNISGCFPEFFENIKVVKKKARKSFIFYSITITLWLNYFWLFMILLWPVPRHLSWPEIPLFQSFYCYWIFLDSFKRIKTISRWNPWSSVGFQYIPPPSPPVLQIQCSVLIRGSGETLYKLVWSSLQ